MRKIFLSLIALVVFAFVYQSCTTEMEEEFDTLSEKIKTGPSGNGGSSGGTCPVGTWIAPACGSRAGTQVLTFGSDGKGSFSNPDCNGVCTPLVFRFNYTVSGNRISFSYYATDVTRCTGYADSKPNVPSGTYSMTFVCSGNNQMTTTSTSGVVSYTRQ